MWRNHQAKHYLLRLRPQHLTRKRKPNTVLFLQQRPFVSFGSSPRSSTGKAAPNYGSSSWPRYAAHASRMQQRFSSSSAAAPSFNSSSNSFASLKAMIKPFVLKCHPDVQTSPVAKRVNLVAMQNLNGYLDLLEATCSYGSITKVEWPKQINIDFLLSNSITDDSSNKSNNKKKQTSAADAPIISTRRRVELVVPSKQLRELVLIPEERARAISKLHASARQELRKVLTVAGLPVPAVCENDQQDFLDEAWREELSFLDDENDEDTTGVQQDLRFRNGLQRPKPTSRYEASRERFVKSLNHKRLQQIYNEALRDAQADIETRGLIGNHARWRQEFINDIIAKIRVDKQSVEDVDLIQQLIATRRLSLLFKDNFDELQMEDMGNLWENLVIVLKSQRAFNTSGSALHKRKKRMQESGFRFSFNTENEVTVHVPIDFGDEELLQELQRNLQDFYNVVMADELDDLFPSWAR